MKHGEIKCMSEKLPFCSLKAFRVPFGLGRGEEVNQCSFTESLKHDTSTFQNIKFAPWDLILFPKQLLNLERL